MWQINGGYDRPRASFSAPLTFLAKPDTELDGIAFWTMRAFYEPRMKAAKE